MLNHLQGDCPGHRAGLGVQDPERDLHIIHTEHPALFIGGACVSHPAQHTVSTQCDLG